MRGRDRFAGQERYERRYLNDSMFAALEATNRSGGANRPALIYRAAFGDATDKTNDPVVCRRSVERFVNRTRTRAYGDELEQPMYRKLWHFLTWLLDTVRGGEEGDKEQLSRKEIVAFHKGHVRRRVAYAPSDDDEEPAYGEERLANRRSSTASTR